MAMAVKSQERHGITRYRGGCRCATCRAAAAAAKRRQRAANPNAQTVSESVYKSKVVALPGSSTQPQTAAMGPVESAWRSEFAAMAETHKVTFAQGCAISAKIDDEAHGALIARNSAELDKLRAELRGPKRKMAARGSRLATVQQMSKRRAQ